LFCGCRTSSRCLTNLRTILGQRVSSSHFAIVQEQLLTVFTEPQGKTLLQYSPSGRKLIVAGLANFVRTYNTGDEDNVVIVDNVPDETNAVIAGVGIAQEIIQSVLLTL
jgi:hypothetical protein